MSDLCCKLVCGTSSDVKLISKRHAMTAFFSSACRLYHYTVACKSLGTPCRICENVNSFNKIREIIQNACYFLFSTVLSKIFYIKYVYI